MPEFCTCGVQLVEGARFCHKCGKDQREETPLAEVPAPPPLPALVVVQEPPRIGFHNRVAVWIALRVGILAFLLSSTLGILTILWLIAGGFFCVYLYRRRTGHHLSVLSGAHLGWLSGVFMFVITTILITIIVAALTQPEILAQFREQWRTRFPEVDANPALEILRSPGGVASLLTSLFVLFTALPAFGGAIGAKLLGRGGSPANHGNA